MSIATISKPYTFTVGTTANPTEVNADFDTVYTGTNNAIAELNTAMGSDTSINARIGKIEAVAGTNAALLTSIKAVDGAASGIDADLLDGKHLAEIIQIKAASTKALASFTGVVAIDDSIPQNTEGTEVLTLAITPAKTTNKLHIEVNLIVSCSGSVGIIGALFQDTTADALAAAASYASSNTVNTLTLKFDMDAGTTSETTFKVRVGIASQPGGVTAYLNGVNNTRIFGGVATSSITITEIYA